MNHQAPQPFAAGMVPCYPLQIHAGSSTPGRTTAKAADVASVTAVSGPGLFIQAALHARDAGHAKQAKLYAMYAAQGCFDAGQCDNPFPPATAIAETFDWMIEVLRKAHMERTGTLHLAGASPAQRELIGNFPTEAREAAP